MHQESGQHGFSFHLSRRMALEIILASATSNGLSGYSLFLAPLDLQVRCSNELGGLPPVGEMDTGTAATLFSRRNGVTWV